MPIGDQNFNVLINTVETDIWVPSISWAPFTEESCK